jgi:prepilin peptidase CpaA
MMAQKLLPLTPMLLLLIWAAVEDIRTRRIRNWLTFSMAAAGIISSFMPNTVLSPSQAGLGLLVGFAIPFVLFALGALGGGDVKLLAGIGAWIGAEGALKVFIVTAVLGLIIVLVQCAYQGKLFALFRNSAVLAFSLVHIDQTGAKATSELGKSCRSIDRPLPYAVPVLFATLAVITMLI